MRTLRGLCLAFTLTVLLAACSSSGGAGPTGPLGGGTGGGSSQIGVTSHAAGSGVGVKAGSNGGYLLPDQVLALCKRIPAADVQALLVPKVQGIAIGCAFLRPGEAANGDNLTARVQRDPTGHTYKNLSGPNDHPLAGVGDKAYWNEAVQGASAPEVTAAKGTLTCVVQTPADAGVLTIAKTGRGPIYQISDAAAAAYAVLLGRLCTDLFTLAG